MLSANRKKLGLGANKHREKLGTGLISDGILKDPFDGSVLTSRGGGNVGECQVLRNVKAEGSSGSEPRWKEVTRGWGQQDTARQTRADYALRARRLNCANGSLANQTSQRRCRTKCAIARSTIVASRHVALERSLLPSPWGLH